MCFRFLREDGTFAIAPDATCERIFEMGERMVVLGESAHHEKFSGSSSETEHPPSPSSS